MQVLAILIDGLWYILKVPADLLGRAGILNY